MNFVQFENNQIVGGPKQLEIMSTNKKEIIDHLFLSILNRCKKLQISLYFKPCLVQAV